MLGIGLGLTGLRQGSAGAAPVCTITLTGDAASAVGAGVPDIDGQSFSVTDAVTGLYLASSPFAALRPMPESGKIVWIEGSGYSISAPFGSSAGVGFTGIDALGEPIATAFVRLKNGSFQMEMERPAGTRVSADYQSMPSQSGGFSVGIGGDGQVYFYLRSAGEVLNASTIDPLFADVFVGVETLLITGAVIVDTGGTGTGGATIVTNQSGMTDRAALAATGTGEDWCGNPIGAAFNPLDLFNGADIFLIGGQSNAAGSAGDADGSPDVALYQSLMWMEEGGFVPTNDPVGGVGTGSAWPAFATRWFEETGRRCILVQSASSGSGQTAASAIAEGHHWDDGGNRYPDAVSMFDDALNYLSARGVSVVVRGILWHQGERDSQALEGATITAAEYRSAFENMVSKFRTKYGSGFELWLFRVGTRNSGDTAGFQGIRDEQYDASIDASYIHLAYSDCVNFPARSWMLDELHYIQSGYNDMGSRGAAAIAMKTGLASWTPDSVLSGVTNSFWRASLANGTLFQDADLTQIADESLDPVGGVINHSSIGTATLSQSAESNKFKLAVDGRIERDATTNTQHLLFGGLTIDFANGFCVAADFDTGGANTVMFGASSLTFYVRRIGDDLVLRVGEAVNRTILGVFSASGPHRRRVIVSGDSVDFTVFIDGVDSGTMATGGDVTSYSSSALGVRVPGEAIVQPGKWGNFLVAEKDLRANAAEIDAWLERGQ